jgi:hypothetical protein
MQAGETVGRPQDLWGKCSSARGADPHSSAEARDRGPYRTGQEQQLGALGLVVNAITVWNSRDTDRAVTVLSNRGRIVDPADIGRISPLHTKRSASTAATPSTSPKPYGKAASDPSPTRPTPGANFVPLVPGPQLPVEPQIGGQVGLRVAPAARSYDPDLPAPQGVVKRSQDTPLIGDPLDTPALADHGISPFGGQDPLEEVLEVVSGLVQVEDQGEGHLGHQGFRGGHRSWVTMSMVRRASSAP